ncbi:MAG: arsenate reductase ArsC [Candidatus Omnitrophota bacterium]
MKKSILFLCTGNSCRSQMAEGLLRNLAGNKFEVFSAGINPTQVNPLAIKVMSEIDIDISKHISRSVSEFSGRQFDYVITVCGNANESCPVFPGSCKKRHWDLEDPAQARGTEEERITVFRHTRDIIVTYVKEFLKEEEK